MELFSGELTRAGSGGDFAPSPPNTVCLLFLLASQLKTIYSTAGLFTWAMKAEREIASETERERGVCKRGGASPSSTLHSPVPTTQSGK